MKKGEIDFEVQDRRSVEDPEYPGGDDPVLWNKESDPPGKRRKQQLPLLWYMGYEPSFGL